MDRQLLDRCVAVLRRQGCSVFVGDGAALVQRRCGSFWSIPPDVHPAAADWVLGRISPGHRLADGGWDEMWLVCVETDRGWQGGDPSELVAAVGAGCVVEGRAGGFVTVVAVSDDPFGVTARCGDTVGDVRSMTVSAATLRDSDELVQLRDLPDVAGCPRGSLNHVIARPDFPVPIRHSPRMWRASEVRHWVGRRDG